jgi:hypothetical protein
MECHSQHCAGCRGSGRRHEDQRPSDQERLDRHNILDDANLRDTITKTSEYLPALPKDREVADLAAKDGLK